ncbi:MAG: ABC transporter ATP-binding protein [Actinomycetota bacterium]
MKRLLLDVLRPYRRQILLVLGLLLVQSIANLYLPTLNADIINNGVAKGDTHYIVRTGGEMLFFTLLMGVAAVIAVYFGARVAMAFGRDVRSRLFRRVQSFSHMELNRFGAPTLTTRTTNDVQQVQMLVLIGLTLLASAPIMAIGGIFMALRLNARLSLLLVVILPLMGAVVAFMVRRAVPLFRQVQVKLDRINLVMREKLSGVRVIRAFDRDRHEERRFELANADLTETSLRVTRLFALLMPTVMLIINLSTAAVMWFGSLQVGHGEMPVGDLTAFLTYLMQILFSVLMATILFVLVPRAAASADRIQEVLDVESTVLDPATPAPSPERLGRLEFRDVTFRYPGADEPVLSNISFTARPGETTAIIGSTGGGKSTLVNLIPRLYDVSAGSVLVDGVDVRELGQQDLWSRIGLVPQRAFLFAGTIGSNVRDGREDATEDEIWHALSIAQASEFVREMPDGLESPVAQGGANLSGGQRLGMAIARAVDKRPELYIFDDSFSALDFAPAARLRTALPAETSDATVLIVAQRVGTIMHAERIIVLADGRIAGIGTHDELLETCDTYREIVFSQLSPEEVA